MTRLEHPGNMIFDTAGADRDASLRGSPFQPAISFSPAPPPGGFRHGPQALSSSRRRRVRAGVYTSAIGDISEPREISLYGTGLTVRGRTLIRIGRRFLIETPRTLYHHLSYGETERRAILR